MARAATENFPVASRLLPRAEREHLLAVYGFARLVDELGDSTASAPEDRLAALDWLEAELDLAFAGRAEHPLMVATRAHDRRVRPAARAVRAADRGQPPRPAPRPLPQLGGAAGVLRAVGRPRRRDRARHLRPRRARADRALGLDLHRAAARRALPGRRRGPRPRADLPAAGGPRALRLRRGRTGARARGAAAASGARVRGAARRAACSAKGCRCWPACAAARAWPWPRSPPAAAPRSTRSNAPASTCCRARRAPARRGGWRARGDARGPGGAGDERARARSRRPTRAARRSRGSRRRTSTTGSGCSPASAGARCAPSTRSPAGSTTSATARSRPSRSWRCSTSRSGRCEPLAAAAGDPGNRAATP